MKRFICFILITMAFFTVTGQGHYKKIWSGNGTEHFNINLVDLGSSGIEAGDEIGAFDGQNCVGSAVVSFDDLAKGRLSIAASSNDNLQQETNGFREGHEVSLRMFSSGKEYSLRITAVNNSGIRYEKGGSLFAKIEKEQTTGKTDIGLEPPQISCYPNPFRETCRIGVSGVSGSELSVAIYDEQGKKVKVLFNGPGRDEVSLTWDGTNDAGQRVTPGMYACRVNNQWLKIIYTK